MEPAERDCFAHDQDVIGSRTGDGEPHRTEWRVTYWRAVGKPEWADALEQCLAKAERCQTMQDVALDLRQRLEQNEGGGECL